jgi:hypothetical protein
MMRAIGGKDMTRWRLGLQISQNAPAFRTHISTGEPGHNRGSPVQLLQKCGKFAPCRLRPNVRWTRRCP